MRRTPAIAALAAIALAVVGCSSSSSSSSGAGGGSSSSASGKTVDIYSSLPLQGASRPIGISLQNGIDNEDRIADVIGAEHVVGGAAYILGSVTEPGVVDAAGPRSIVIGELSGERSERIAAIQEVGARAGLGVGLADDIRVALWEKYVLLVAFSAMTGTVRLPIGAIRDAPAAKAMLEALMTEVWAVGRAAGVNLADGLVAQEMQRLLSQHDGASTSLYHDLVTGHRMELEALQGAAIRIGREHAVPTPNLDAAYAILQPWALRNERPVEERVPTPT